MIVIHIQVSIIIAYFIIYNFFIIGKRGKFNDEDDNDSHGSDSHGSDGQKNDGYNINDTFIDDEEGGMYLHKYIIIWCVNLYIYIYIYI